MANKPRQIQEFMKSPFGAGFTAVNNEPLRVELKKRYVQLKKDKNPVKLSGVYKNRNTYYYHLIIPSESERTNNYDVVIALSPSNKLTGLNDSFTNRWAVTFFSNCPSFTYTFAHVYRKANLLIEFFYDKYDDDIFRLKPESHNPVKLINYDKSIYFALLFLEENPSYYNKNVLDNMSSRTDFKALLRIIRTDNKIQKEIKEEQKRISELKKATRKSIDRNVGKINSRDKVHDPKSYYAFNSITKFKKKSKITPSGKIRPKKKI